MAKSVILNSCSIPGSLPGCLESLKKEERDELDANSVFIDYKKGEHICKQGAFASHIMILLDGLAKVYVEGSNSKLILKIVPYGNILGLTSLFEGNTVFHYSAQAYLNSKVQLVDINVFRDLISRNPLFASKIISKMGENALIVYGRFFCLTKKQTYGRLADILLCLSQRIYKSDSFPIQLSRKELADLSDMSIESVARIMSKFKADKLIEETNDTLLILDIERLMIISQNG
jgi:CRP/FNR family transcriptional regulator